MRYFLDEVNGFSTNVFKLLPQNSQEASANRILRFTLPSNSLLNLRSFSLNFNMSADVVDDSGGRLPAGIDRVVQRVEVACGGVQLSAGANYYNVLQQAKLALQGNDNNGQLGHPDCVRTLSYVDNGGGDPGVYPTFISAGSGTFPDRAPVCLKEHANESYRDSSGKVQFSISKWDGFLGSCAPSIIDSSLLPDIVISIFLDDDGILGSVNGPFMDMWGKDGTWPAGTNDVAPMVTNYSKEPAQWSMKNISATIECIGLSDGVLDALEASIIAEQGSLRVPFKNYFSFEDTTTSTMRFNVATQSLDRIWVCHRKQGRGDGAAQVAGSYVAANQAGLRRVEGYKHATGAEMLKEPASIDDNPKYLTECLVAGIAGYDSGGNNVVDCNKERYMTARFEMAEPVSVGYSTDAPTDCRFQFSLNGSFYPQFQATYEEMLNISRNSVAGWREDHISLYTQRQNFSVQCARLCLPETGVRKISGFDTRSVSLNGYYYMYNVAGGFPQTVTLFAECTSVLRVGEARQLEVVQ